VVAVKKAGHLHLQKKKDLFLLLHPRMIYHFKGSEIAR